MDDFPIVLRLSLPQAAFLSTVLRGYVDDMSILVESERSSEAERLILGYQMRQANRIREDLDEVRGDHDMNMQERPE